MSNIEEGFRRFCKKRFPLPSEEQVAALEDRLGVTLPSKYRWFLLEYNGGYFTEPDIVPPTEDCPLDGLDVLNGIGASHPSGELGFNTNLFSDNDPPQILPIGYTLMGNLLFMVTDPTDELPGWIGMKIAFRQKWIWLADDIEEFFGLLRQNTAVCRLREFSALRGLFVGTKTYEQQHQRSLSALLQETLSVAVGRAGGRSRRSPRRHFSL